MQQLLTLYKKHLDLLGVRLKKKSILDNFFNLFLLLDKVKKLLKIISHQHLEEVSLYGNQPLSAIEKWTIEAGNSLEYRFKKR